MLRDKFIHYFQQWRERQLSRGEHWLTQHLAGRSPREKGMLLAAVVFRYRGSSATVLRRIQWSLSE